jgi:hypothetical protein
MSEPATPTGPADVNPRVHHETSDVSIRGILISAAVLIAVTIVSAIALWFLQYDLERRRKAADRPPFPGATVTFKNFPDPQMEVAPAAALEIVREEEQKNLNARGWVDEKSGVARIPIDEAMNRIVERGLPKWSKEHAHEH